MFIKKRYQIAFTINIIYLAAGLLSLNGVRSVKYGTTSTSLHIQMFCFLLIAAAAIHILSVSKRFATFTESHL